MSVPPKDMKIIGLQGMVNVPGADPNAASGIVERDLGDDKFAIEVNINFGPLAHPIQPSEAHFGS